ETASARSLERIDHFREGLPLCGLFVPIVESAAGRLDLRVWKIRRDVAQGVHVVLRPETARRCVRGVRAEAVFAEARVEECCNVRKIGPVLCFNVDSELVREEISHLIEFRAGPDHGVTFLVEYGSYHVWRESCE